MKSTLRSRPGPICMLCQIHRPTLQSQLPSTRVFQHLPSTLKTASSFTRATGGSRRFATGYTLKGTDTQRFTLGVKDLRTPSPSEAGHGIGKVQAQAFRILNSQTVLEEKEVLQALKSCEAVAQELVGYRERPVSSKKQGNTPASALLSLDSRPPPSVSLDKSIELLSNLAYKVVTHSNVFISPSVLKVYVRTQCLLQRPASFPEVFTLYATKPVPQLRSSPVKYSNPNPNKASAAIPSDIANMALDCAIAQKDLDLCLAIISTSFTTASYRRSLLLRRLTLPVAGLALSPLAAYTLASTLSSYQETMDPSFATGIAFAGILSYIGFTATIGVVAVTTSNDQMDRVTWATGMPLRERWLREGERAAVDKVAQAWGFKEQWRRGEEEGEEWEHLKEWAGLSGMVLDKVSLMEGME